ncbi:uncharacterized protein LOC127867691 [Dreissena polymorpha]|uniref:MICOS complex subunit MIC13 n=1 Tax=Dreissena polymorpha TaxID=45954 RepID=A0A9D4M1M4_DREPO|nr:uncharacterized protein LOC127867691 [Dreissena polymorpha]KAH3867994.1 hypothetical protein DPMN_031130 [Dreissena polymorpha]
MATLAKTILKVGIAGGAVAGTASYGVWSADTKQGAAALERVKASLPSAQPYVNKIPGPADVGKDVTSKWNTGVQTIFQNVSSVPGNTVKFVQKTIGDLSK